MRSWEAVCEFLEQLPGAEQAPLRGQPAVRVHGKVLAFPALNDRSRPDNASDDEEFVVVKVGLAEREALLQQDPETFFVTPHYAGYPGVIVRLATVQPKQLRELLVEAWRLVAPKRLVRSFDES